MEGTVLKQNVWKDQINIRYKHNILIYLIAIDRERRNSFVFFLRKVKGHTQTAGWDSVSCSAALWQVSVGRLSAGKVAKIIF